jgi:hypothetical protein
MKGQDKIQEQYIFDSIHNIKYHMQRNIANVIFTGERLDKVKTYLSNQQYKSFLNDNFGWSIATAWKKIQIAKKFKDYNIDLLKNFDVSALYVMVSPLITKESIDKLIALSQTEHITAKKARNFLLLSEEQDSTDKANDLEHQTDNYIIDQLFIIDPPHNNILKNKKRLFKQPFLNNMGDVYNYCTHNKSFWTYQHYLKLVSLSEDEFANIDGIIFYLESPKFLIFYSGDSPKKNLDGFSFKKVL